MGKTSLLNAGLSPRLRAEDFRPIRIRLKFSEDEPPLKEQIRRAFEKGLAPNENDKKKVKLESQIDVIKPVPLSANETLWEYFRRVRHFTATEEKGKKPVTPVLVFDQFEEIFTIGKDHKEIDKIIEELYWLVEDQFPPELTKQALEDNDKKARKLLYSNARPHFKVILSLREDFLPQMNSLKSRIPSINRAPFRVIHLDGIQARDVISKPEGSVKDENTIQKILKLFYPKKEIGEGGVPEKKLEVVPAFLSLVCSRMFEKGIFKAENKDDLEKLIKDYYDSTLKAYPTAVHEFIESGLLTEGGFRTPRVLDANFPLNEYIDKLVEDRILRKFHDGHKQYVEIIHDFLTPIFQKRRTQRIRRKKRKQISIVIAVFFVLTVSLALAIIKWINANTQTRIAHANRLTTEALLESEKDNTKAIRIAEAAIKQAKSNPAPRAIETLSKIGYSTSKKPFYRTLTSLDDKDVIYSAVFSSDNKCTLTAHENGTAQIHDLTGKSVLVLAKHGGRVNSAMFSPDETLILTASSDNTAILWDREGKPLKELNHDGGVTCASFSPNGKLILTASLDNTARLWNLHGTQQQIFKHTGRVVSATFSPDGNYILTASWDKTAKLWNKKGHLLADLNKHNGTLNSASFSPNSQHILTGSWDKTVKLWNFNGEVLADFEHDEAIVSSLFSNGGKFILAAGAGGSVKVWDLGSKKLKATMKHEGHLSMAAFSPDSEFFLTAAEEGTVKMWDLQGNLKAHFDKHSQKVRAAAFSPDGRHLFTSSHGESAIIWDLHSNIVKTLKHNYPVSSAKFSPDGKSILTTSKDGTATLWKADGEFLANLEHLEKIQTVFFSPKTGVIFTASNDGTVKRWTPNGKLIDKHKGERMQLTELYFSKDGNKTLTLSNSENAILWNLQGDILREFKHEQIICNAAYASNGKAILTVSCCDSGEIGCFEGGIIKLWNLDDDNNNKTKPFIQKDFASATFSPDGNLVLIAAKTGELSILNLSGKILYQLNLPLKNKALISASFSPGDRYILTILTDGAAVLWALNGTPLGHFNCEGDIYNATFSPDGNQILTASLDKKAKLWDLQGNLHATFEHDGAVFSAAFSPDGKRIVTASRDGTAKVWMTPYAILQWLENSKTPMLSEDDKRELQIQPYDN
jgi:WD40 repeat protein